MDINLNSDNNLESDSLPNFNELKVNPSYLLQLVNKYVQVQLIKNTSISGFIHSIDPIGDNSIIMLVPREDKFGTTIIPGHAILDLCVKEPETNLVITNKQPSQLDTRLKDERKIKMLCWLKDHKLPVRLENDNIIIENITILPPYSLTNVCSDNPILQMRICNLMERMPHNYIPSSIP